jgi:hypothetical protein
MLKDIDASAIPLASPFSADSHMSIAAGPESGTGTPGGWIDPST